VVIPAITTADDRPAQALPAATPAISVYLLVHKVTWPDGAPLGQGIYRTDPRSGELVLVRAAEFAVLKHCADLADLTAEPAAVLLLCLHMRARRQYVNAYELALLEAGQLLQNLSLTATSAQVAACILGSVFDEPFWSLAGSDPSVAVEKHGTPIVAMALGYSDVEEGGSS